MYCETHTSHNFMFVLTWLYGVIVSDGGVESHCETIEIAIAGILNKLYAWIQVVYLNRSHSLLMNRLLLYVFHLFYTSFFDDMVAVSFRIYDDRPRDRVSYSWRMMLIISTSLTSSLRLGKWRAWHWPLLWKFWSSAEYYCISTILVLIIASCHHYVMWSTYMITSYEDFTSSFIRKLLNR